MTMLFMDSFDHYTTFLDKWSAVSGDSAPVIETAAVRLGTHGVRINGANTPGRGNINLPGSYSTVIVGTAFRMVSLSVTPLIISLFEGGTQHLDVAVTTGGVVLVRRGDTTTLGTSTARLVAGVWYYVELKANIHDSTGSFELRIDGANVTSDTNVDTRNGGSGVIDTVQIRGAGNGQPACHWDDLYVCDTSGSVNNDFLGDLRIQSIFPSGNGNSSQLVGSDANSTDNYLLVDETTPNDADYVESSTVDDKDTYAYSNLTPTTGTVHAVQVMTRAAKTDAGVRSVASVARLSTDEVDSSDKTLSTTYTYYPDIRETKPGGGAWSIANVNDAEFGVKVTA